MENQDLGLRLPMILHSYLDDLKDIGLGSTKTGIARRFIENGIAAALEGGLLTPKKVKDFETGTNDGQAENDGDGS